MVFATQNLRHYMLNKKINLISKIDPYLVEKATLIGRIANWVVILSEFNIEYVDRR